MERAEAVLAQIRNMSREVLGDNLAGLYVHGSLAFGCFRWDVSDIDYLAVVKAPVALEDRMEYIRALTEIDRYAPPKGIEMSIVPEEDCRMFCHPARYVLHFSHAHLDGIRADLRGYCQRMQGRDPDLAAHFAVTRAAGRAIWGEPIETMFAPVDRAACLDSILYDVGNAETDIEKNPAYITLNLCRALAYAREERILSKAQGGEWGLRNLPARFHTVIRQAAQAYGSGGTSVSEDSGKELRAFAGYMLGELRP